MVFAPPSHDCPLCPRLATFREENRIQYPGFFNGPVPSFGEMPAPLLIVGLAPGLKGANRTGRPFTGDFAGEVLYSSLKKYGFAAGRYDPEAVRPEAVGLGHKSLFVQGGGGALRAADDFRLINCRISNGVRCVPPENKPETVEIKTCNRFLAAEIKAMPNLKAILTLGLIAHKAVLMALGLKQSAFAFGHAAQHKVGVDARPLLIMNSYHCSRYNINTGTLTQAMFDEVVEQLKEKLRSRHPEGA